ncbi:spermatogenesis-associated protein 31E1-like [Ursus americanus]|uniref:spermatogenesis-associated protein 31E1-like n=1 Tax=Ursus americanus TaxID=9643 RepID=UPI001E67A467|nr:spermatogenesis-associated protein 31E1-like [Ursus americanus]
MVIIGKPKCNRMNWFQGGMGQVVALHSQSYVDLVAIMDSRVNAAFRMETHRDPWHGHFIAVFLEMKDMGSPTLDLYESSSGATETEKQQQEEKPNSESHLGKLADQGGFHQLLRQAAPGHVHKAAPAGAHQPCREPVEDATPTVAASPSPAPPTGGPPPLASTVSPEPMTSSISVHSHYSLTTSWPSEPSLPPFGLSHRPLALLPSPPCLSPSEAGRPPLTASSAPARPDSLQTLPQCNSMAPPLRSIPQSSSPHTLWLASPVPAISGLGRSSCPIPALSWWQETAKAWGLSTSTRLESHQEPLSHSPPGALFWGDPTHRQGEMRIPPFINPDVQKLLEILIAKRTELKIWKEKEKKERSDGHLNSFGRIFKSPGDKQDTMGCQSFWSMSGKPNQLLGPEKPPHSKISADNLQQKCSQLFWGLPFLHSESLVATVRVTDSSLEFPSVIFNELSHALPLQIQTNMGTCEVSCPASQKTPSFISNAIQNLECHFLKKQQDGDWTLPAVVKRSQEVFSQGPPNLPQDAQAPQGHGAVSVLPGDLINSELREQLEWHLWKRLMKHQSGLPHRIQLSVKLVQPHGEFQKVPEAHSRHRPAWSSESTDGSCQAAQKPGSRYSARTVPGKSLGKDSRSSAGRIQKDLHRASASSPEKAPGINSEESDTDLRPLTSSADEEPPEKVLRAHLGRKLGQIREGQIPADVHHSRFAANHASDLPGTPSTHRKTGKPAFSKGWEPYRTTAHDFSILSPYTQRMLEAHIIRFRVKHRWSLPLKVLKPINLFKLKKSFLFPRSSTPRLGTCASKTRSKTKFLGKPPQTHQGEVMGESIPTSGGPLPAPQPSCEEIQPGLEGTSSGDGHGPCEAPLAGQEARPPSQTLTYSFVGRIWHSETAQGTLTNSSLESSPSPAMATNEPRRESGSRASRDSCCSVTVLELNLESQYLSAREEAREVREVEEAPAWGVTSEPRVLANNQSINADLRRSRSSGKSDNPSPPTKLVAQDPEERCLDAQLREFELGKLAQSESQPQDEAASVLLQDCETGVLLQDCATDSLLQDCQSNVFLAADILASQGSLSGFQSGSSEDTSTSQMLYDRKSSRQNSQRQPEPPGLQDPYKRPRKSSVPTDDRGCYRRPRPGEPEKELSELKIFQISEMRHPVQEKESAQSSGSKVCQLLLKKEEAPPESYFRRRLRNFLQWFFPNKGKGLESSLQKGKSSSSRSRAKVRGRSGVDSAPSEAQVVLTAVGQILEEKMVPHHGVRAPDYSWCKRDLQASAGPNVCYHRVLSYQEQRRVMRETASCQQATPKSHSCANKTEWIRGRDNRVSTPLQLPAQVERSYLRLPHRGQVPRDSKAFGQELHNLKVWPVKFRSKPWSAGETEEVVQCPASEGVRLEYQEQK